MWQDALHRGTQEPWVQPAADSPCDLRSLTAQVGHWERGLVESQRVTVGELEGEAQRNCDTEASANPTDVCPELGRPFGGIHAEAEASPRSPLRPALGGVALVPGRFLPLRVAASATVPAAGEQGLVLQGSGATAPTHHILSQPPTHGVRLHSACH